MSSQLEKEYFHEGGWASKKQILPKLKTDQTDKNHKTDNTKCEMKNKQMLDVQIQVSSEY